MADDDFDLLDPPGTVRVRLRFDGRFQGRSVRWDATLETLQASAQPRNYIEIGEEGPAGRRLHVGLDVPLIDLPTVRKTVVMIRNYKRLQPGRHEFGTPGN